MDFRMFLYNQSGILYYLLIALVLLCVYSVNGVCYRNKKTTQIFSCFQLFESLSFADLFIHLMHNRCQEFLC